MNELKPAESLKEFKLTDKNREEAKVGSTLFLRKLETWSSIETTVRDYFTLTETHAPTPRPLYNKVLEVLDNISQEEVKIKKGVKTSCQKPVLYYKNNASKLVFFEKYEDLDRELRKQKSQQVLDDENIIAGNIMVAQMVKESSRSMLLLSPPQKNTSRC